MGHVKEAFRLLSKSIIRVETPDINLEEEPDVPEQTGLSYINVFYTSFCLIIYAFQNVLHCKIKKFSVLDKIKQIKQLFWRR